MYAQFVELLDHHGVREPVLDVLLWEKPRRSLFLLFSGVFCYVLVRVLGVGMLTVIGTLAIVQLFVYRTCEALQKRKVLISEDVNLREVVVVTPDASTISISVELIGDILRMIEEFIKEISLTADYFQLVMGIFTLTFLAILGRLVSLPTLLLLSQLLAFSLPLFYLKNQARVDATMEGFMSKLGRKSKPE